MKSIYAKILQVQRNMRPIEKDAMNPHFRNKYFDINGLLAVLKPVLNDAGLVVMQNLVHENGQAALSTIIADPDTGESMDSRVILPQNSDPQKMGAIVSYFRRYALTSTFLLEGEDDDGNTAVHAKTAPKPAQPSKADQDKLAIVNALKSLGHEAKDKEVITAKVKDLAQLDLVPANFGEILSRLNVLVKEKK